MRTTRYVDDTTVLAEALEAQRLVELPDRWLNPPEWVEWVDEPVPGYWKRLVPRDENAAKTLKKRTVTNLYNARPQWLADGRSARRRGGGGLRLAPDITDDDALHQMLALNGR